MSHRTTHIVPHHVLGDSVVFASTPWLPEAGACLALHLLKAMGRLSPRWSGLSHDRGLTLHKSTLGSPYLLLGGRKGPSLSFSHGEKRLWGAMCSKGRVGIDVAYPEEFAGDYPFARAFRREELDCATAFCHKDTALGAALIWSVKEASVKATGAGFNRFDPLEVRVGSSQLMDQGVLFDVEADRPMTAWTRREGRGWLAVALAWGDVVKKLTKVRCAAKGGEEVFRGENHGSVS